MSLVVELGLVAVALAEQSGVEIRRGRMRGIAPALAVEVDRGIAGIARVTPLGANQYGLRFHSHTGRWETMPFVGELVPLAHDLVAAPGPYLARPDFCVGIRGSGH